MILYKTIKKINIIFNFYLFGIYLVHNVIFVLGALKSDRKQLSVSYIIT